jgi:glucose-1-phosphate thymidylyltransferase
VESHIVRGWWKDTGHLEDILEANRLILEDIETRVEGELIDSHVEGRVVIESGARLERSTVRGPAIIGRNTRITDAYVGPYSAIDENVTIDRAEIEHSIVMADSTIQDLGGRMEASLIGCNVTLRRNNALPRAYRFVVGEDSEIQIL